MGLDPKPTKVVGNEPGPWQPKPTKVGDVCTKCARSGVVAHFISPYGNPRSKICDMCGILSTDSCGPPAMVSRNREGATDEQWKAYDDAMEEKQRMREEGYDFDD